MISPRPSFDTSSDEDISEYETVGVPATRQSPQPQTSVSVGTINVDEKATMPGILNGVLNTTTLNFMINSEINGDVTPDDLGDLVTDAVKINSRTIKSFIPKDITNSTSKLTGTKDEVEGLSRRWCYLIASLVVLSFITLLGTAVLSLTSWRTAQGPATDISPATQTTIDGLSAEEKHFAEMANGPKIITRSMWLAAPSWGPLDNNLLPVTTVVVCHTETSSCTSQPECIQLMRAMQRYQQETRHLADLGYNFLIGGDGSVYWSRGFNFMGAHTRGFNNGTIGVAFIGNYINLLPGEIQMKAFNKLIQVGLKEGKIAPDYSLVAQCQLRETTAPGLALVHYMSTWPHYNASLRVRCTPR